MVGEAGGGEDSGGAAQSVGDVVSSDPIRAVLGRDLLGIGRVWVLSTKTANVSSEETTVAAAAAVFTDIPPLLVVNQQSGAASAFSYSDT